MTERSLDPRLKMLAVIRTSLGSSLLLLPRVTGRLLFFDVERNPALVYVARLFAVRNVVLGSTLLTTDGAERSRWVRVGAACDVVDAAAGLAAARRREISPVTAVLVVGVALLAAALGVKSSVEGTT
jgi:hypothetical protein